MLRIRNIGEHIPFVASWRMRVLLPAGRYFLQARVRAEGFMAMDHAPGGGIALRAYGYSVAPVPVQFAPEFPWTILRSEFSISGPEQKVQVICEVRAFKGTILVDETSLELFKSATVN